MIIAGEASGDLHGASLIKELLLIDSGLKICGIGGDKMIAAGMDAQYHIKNMAFLGFAEVVKHIPFIKKVQRDLIEKIKNDGIKTVVLIDYPGFNLSIAKKLKKLGVDIFYYISPQLWAWGKGRIEKIRKLVKKMIVVFPFEKDFYAEHNIDAAYVGHPLIEQIAAYKFLSKDEFFSKFGLDKDKKILLLLPGSREQEIKRIFPACIEAASRLSSELNLQTVVACSSNINEEVFSSLTDKNDFKIIKGFTYELLKYSGFGIIKSGTSTLEAGLFALPFIVVYSTSRITYTLGKMLIKVKNIAMANIISGEDVVDELIQDDVNAETIYQKAKTTINDKAKYDTIKQKLEKIKSKLGEPGASKRTAEIVYAGLNER